MKYDIDLYDPCPCGSGEKYKFCCAARNKANRHGKFPIGTVAYYGPDDKTATKIAAGVITREDAEPILERWTSTNITKDPKIAEQVKQFLARHGVKNTVITDGIIGCPHEEGIDFPSGQDCPFCPFWADKQGTARRDEDELNQQSEDEVEEEDELLEEEDDRDDDNDEKSDEERDWEASFARSDAILGGGEIHRSEALKLMLANLKAKLQMPCEVTGMEDFQWEERYVVGGDSPAEYKKLKKTQPSYRDRFQLLGLELRGDSEWMMFDDDIAARVKRVSDGKDFVLGLAELEATDKTSQNYQLLDDYAIWFVNSR